MLNALSRFVSVFLHPVFYFFYIFNFFIYAEPDIYFVHPNAGFLLNLLIFFNTVIIPVGILLLLKKKITLPKKDDRPVVFIIVSIIYGAAWYSMGNTDLPDFFRDLLLALALGLFLLGIISYRVKVSLHTTGAGLVSFFFFYHFLYYPDLLWALVVVLVLAGLVGSSRLWLEAHNLKEVAAGYGLGIGMGIIYWIKILILS